MRFSLTAISHVVFAGSLWALAPSVFSAQAPDNIGGHVVSDHVEDKLYRQALYYYFAGDYSGALRQIGLNRQRFQADSARSKLFEAGLQVSVGLHDHATQALYEFEQLAQVTPNTHTSEHKSKGKSSTSPEELMLIARLQLAEQQLEHGNNLLAQQTLAKISQVIVDYAEQYQTLSQLAYWPEQPAVLATVIMDEQSNEPEASTSVYVQLNQALLHMERGEYELAEPLLIAIKNQRWQPAQQTFWQLLFNPFAENNSDTDELSDEKTQQQAVNDYAQLLLAQLLVKQARYEAAFYELKTFPQASPYTESALFLFAFSAQKAKQYSTSIKLLELMQQRYPSSHLGWQSAVLFATQVTEQKTLEEGMASFQQTEQFLKQQLAALMSFQEQFIAHHDVLTFEKSEPTVKPTNVDAIFTRRPYVTNAVWLKKALAHADLQADYQSLMELALLKQQLLSQQQKSQWINDTIALNEQRQAKVISAQQQVPYQTLISDLNARKQVIADIIAKASVSQSGQTFADSSEQEWLQRINNSKQALTYLDGHKNKDEYQQRLARVEGVLTWQLQQKLPVRLRQHQKLLKQLDQQITTVEQQRKRFATLAGSTRLLSDFEQRHQQSATEITSLLARVEQLSTKGNQAVITKVQRFVDNQRNILEQHLLTTRHEMASILEKMSQVDKRIETQLLPKQAALTPTNIPTQQLNKERI